MLGADMRERLAALGVEPAPGQKCRVCPALNDPTVLQDHDLVGIDHR